MVTVVAVGSTILSVTVATGSFTGVAGVSFAETSAVAAALPENLKGTCVGGRQFSSLHAPYSRYPSIE